jgi:hypothetical protein
MIVVEPDEKKEPIIRAIHLLLEALFRIDDAPETRTFLNRPKDYEVQIRLKDKVGHLPDIGTAYKINE